MCGSRTPRRLRFGPFSIISRAVMACLHTAQDCIHDIELATVSQRILQPVSRLSGTRPSVASRTGPPGCGPGERGPSLRACSEKACPGLDPGWVPVFGKRFISTKRLERDDGSNKSHPAPVKLAYRGYCAVLMTASSYLPEPMPLSAKMP